MHILPHNQNSRNNILDKGLAYHPGNQTDSSQAVITDLSLPGLALTDDEKSAIYLEQWKRFIENLSEEERLKLLRQLEQEQVTQTSPEAEEFMRELLQLLSDGDRH